ncbi:hypothetical protein RFI_28759 [Reticulomyxa filosa]|uniref:NADP-dependent oxidoreductase domain-containing protein n=1 Tax=Reticulomyxa filosa TaxID=46433 RepID=X6M4P8_RETFI|nr:hypothetical protein RFI_28759 [Reticulomyxa filosa]|eukprot:ETO08626.1 hypothetical protein RFI_28759 [Reticulomyxa filosa]
MEFFRRVNGWIFWFIFLLVPFLSNGRQCPSGIEIYSFGKPYRRDFLGSYEIVTQRTHEEKPIFRFSSKPHYYLYWTNFHQEIGRWCVSSILGDDGSVIAYKDSIAPNPIEMIRREGDWIVKDGDEWITDESLGIKCIGHISAYEYKSEHNRSDPCLVVDTLRDNGCRLQYTIFLWTRALHNSMSSLAEKIVTHFTDAQQSTTYISLEHNKILWTNDTHWMISQFAFENKPLQHLPLYAIASSNALFPDGIDVPSSSLSHWNVHIREPIANAHMSCHCQVPGKAFYRKHLEQTLRSKTTMQDEMTVLIASDGTIEGNKIVERDNPWSLFRGNYLGEYKLSSDRKYFVWSNQSDDKIPVFGIGTAALNNDRQVILAALRHGYELIDTASDHAPWYQNEWIIGNLFAEQRISKRTSVMITTKLYAADHGFEKCTRAIEDSLQALQVSYIDVMLIHHPHCERTDAEDTCQGTWKSSWNCLESYYRRGKIRYVGVSNFDVWELNELLEYTDVPVSVVQNWYDPLHHNDHVLLICQHLGIVYQAYSILGTQHEMLRDDGDNPVLKEQTNHCFEQKIPKKCDKLF